MISLRHAEMFRLPLRLRMPFRYGITTLTEVPHVMLRLKFEIDGKVHAGFAAENLPPKWFTKNPNRPPAEEIAELVDVIRAAVTQAGAIRAATPFAFWHVLHAAQCAWAAPRGLPPLLANLGTSLVERALLDAFCRARGTTFAQGLRGNAFGLELGALRPTLARSEPRDWLPTSPLPKAWARHTIGLSDPIDTGDIADGERATDGLPKTLVECIRRYGLRHFKIKVVGEPGDRARLARLAAIFAAECGGDFAFSLDGNESFREVAAFVHYARGLLAAPELQGFWPRLLFIEQPWHRDVALSPALADLIREWPDRPPIIIDESDAGLDSLPAALACGYAGTSHKNCKGVFKSVANACLLEQRRRTGAPTVLSGEDLTNVGPVSLPQDLAVAAALGITSVERNGHHYFAGLAQFPGALQEHALRHHSDLFVRTAAGWPRVDICGGQLALGSANAAPFGVAGEPDLAGLERVSLGA